MIERNGERKKKKSAGKYNMKIKKNRKQIYFGLAAQTGSIFSDL
jgi:hypothetical protein